MEALGQHQQGVISETAGSEQARRMHHSRRVLQAFNTHQQKPCMRVRHALHINQQQNLLTGHTTLHIQAAQRAVIRRGEEGGAATGAARPAQP